jgi:hypothetical protein
VGCFPRKAKRQYSSGASAWRLDSQLDAEEFHVEDTHHKQYELKGPFVDAGMAFIATASSCGQSARHCGNAPDVL